MVIQNNNAVFIIYPVYFCTKHWNWCLWWLCRKSSSCLRV